MWMHTLQHLGLEDKRLVLSDLFQFTAALFFVTSFTLLAGCVTPQVSRQAMPIMELTNESLQLPITPDIAKFPKRRYRISIGDQIEVRYLRQLQYSTTVTVGLDGTITLPFIPSVTAQGKTIDELRENLEQQYLDLASSGPDPGSKRYIIGVGDVLEIKFPFWDEYNVTVAVGPDGKISLPLIDSPVIVEGKSSEEVERELTTFYSQHMEKAKTVLVLNIVSSVSNTVIADGKRRRVPLAGLDSIYVTLKTADLPKIYVTGEVERPSAIPYKPMLSSLQAIVAAGGVTNDAELRNVVIVRKGISETPRYIVRDLLADIKGEVATNKGYQTGNNESEDRVLSLTNDIFLRPFDVVIVPKTTIANVRDVLDRYIFDIFPPLRNSAVGFTFTKPVGTQKIEQETNIIGP